MLGYLVSFGSSAKRHVLFCYMVAFLSALVSLPFLSSTWCVYCVCSLVKSLVTLGVLKYFPCKANVFGDMRLWNRSHSNIGRPHLVN